MPIYLIRHTKPDVPEGTCYGVTDLDVTSTFEIEAASIHEAIRRLPSAPTHIFTSPLKRCQKLAAYLSERLHITAEVDQRLIEMNFGNWEMQPWDAIPRDELDAWAADFFLASPHGGESVQMLQKRVQESLKTYQQLEGHILAITHAGVIKAALARGQQADDFNTQVAFGGMIHYQYQYQS